MREFDVNRNDHRRRCRCHRIRCRFHQMRNIFPLKTVGVYFFLLLFLFFLNLRVTFFQLLRKFLQSNCLIKVARSAFRLTISFHLPFSRVISLSCENNKNASICVTVEYVHIWHYTVCYYYCCCYTSTHIRFVSDIAHGTETTLDFRQFHLYISRATAATYTERTQSGILSLYIMRFVFFRGALLKYSFSLFCSYPINGRVF